MSLSIIKYPASAGGGGTITGGVNGLSTSGVNLVLGQDVGAIGDPAILTSNREIPMSTFTIRQRDALGNSNLFGPGTITSTRVSGGDSFLINSTKTTNTSLFCVDSNATVTFGGFSNDTGFALSYIGRKRYNTVAAGVTITTSGNNRQGIFSGTMSYENDVAANTNTITQAGTSPISVYFSRVDFWPGANSQHKTINGSLCHYATQYDAGGLVGSSVTSLIDFEAGGYTGNVSSPLTITNRYGFKVLDLNAGSQVTTNRWAFYQEGVTDSNYFAGFSGFGISAPTAKINIAAGTATAGTAPIKLTSGVNLTTPENGAIEYDGTHYYGTAGGVRLQLDNGVFKGGQSAFTADGVTTVFDIVHNLGATPSYFTLTTTQPITTEHLSRTITFPDGNTMRLTFASAPLIGDNANYVWIVYK